MSDKPRKEVKPKAGGLHIKGKPDGKPDKSKTDKQTKPA